MSFLKTARRIIAAAACVVVTTIVATGFAAAETKSFAKPMHPQGNRLDWCFNWAQGCGKQAADAFCTSHGFKSAVNFSKAVDIGDKHKTRVISTGAVCDQKFCDGFGQIVCNP